MLFLGVVLLTALSQAWCLGLSFQLDDLNLLADPFALFGALRASADAPLDSHMMRFPVWVAWGFVRAPLGEPLSPVPFHALGLAIHALNAGWIALLLRRFGWAECAKLGPWIAGLGYGLSASSATTLGWISGHPDHFVLFFALLATFALLEARRGSRGLAALGYICFALALLSKGPALLVAPLLAILLTSAPPRDRLPRELLALGLVTLGSLVVRKLYLGTFLPTYPGQAGFEFGYAKDGLHRLAQGLFPWNRHPDAVSTLPVAWAERFAWFGDRAPSAIVPLLVAPAAFGFLVAGRKQPLWAFAWILGLVLAVLPGGAVDSGPHTTADPTTNHTSRALVLAFAWTWAALGTGVAGVFRVRREIAWVGLAGLAVLALSLRSHVIEIEREADRIRRSEFERVADAIADHDAMTGDPARPLRLLLESPPSDFAGVAQYGPLYRRCFRRPFLVRDHLVVVQDSSLAGLAPELHDVSIDTLLVPRRPIRERWIPSLSPEERTRIEALEPHALLPEYLGLEKRVPTAYVAGVELPRAPGQVRVGWCESGQPDLVTVGDHEGDGTWFLARPDDPELLLSTLEAVRVEAPGLTDEERAAVRIRTTAPAISFGEEGPLRITVDAAPRVTVTLPEGPAPPTFLRFHLQVWLEQGPLHGLCDIPCSDAGPGWTLPLDRWHTGTDLAPADTEGHGVPWSLFAPALFDSEGLDRRFTRLRVEAYPTKGPPLARSVERPVRFAP